MLLIGQFDSPFVRRVGIALRWYGIAFEHRPLSVFRDSEEIAKQSPLRRVPTLVLDDGAVATESFVCLEHVDELAADTHGEDWDRLLLPRRGPLRREGLRLCGFATGAMEKTVALIYERLVREERRDAWVARCTLQLTETLAHLERERATRPERYLLGGALSHADVAFTCALTLFSEALPDLLAETELPALRAHAARFEVFAEFRDTRQPFVVHTT
jgi:glutathione S-transferase